MLRQPLDLERPRTAIDEIGIPYERLIEALKIAGETGVAWIAPAKDDARLREQNSCHAQCDDVVRHLVDDALRPAADLLQTRNIRVPQAARQIRILLRGFVDISLHIADIL